MSATAEELQGEQILSATGEGQKRDAEGVVTPGESPPKKATRTEASEADLGIGGRALAFEDEASEEGLAKSHSESSLAPGPTEAAAFVGAEDAVEPVLPQATATGPEQKSAAGQSRDDEDAVFVSTSPHSTPTAMPCGLWEC